MFIKCAVSIGSVSKVYLQVADMQKAVTTHATRNRDAEGPKRVASSAESHADKHQLSSDAYNACEGPFARFEPLLPISDVVTQVLVPLLP